MEVFEPVIDFSDAEACRDFGRCELIMQRQAPKLGAEPRIHAHLDASGSDPLPKRRRDG